MQSAPDGAVEEVVAPTSPVAAARDVEIQLQLVVNRLRTAERIAAELAEANETIVRLTGSPTDEPVEASAGESVAVALEAPPARSVPQPDWRPATHTGPMPRLGEMMIARGLLTNEELEAGLQQQRISGKRLGETLVEAGVITSIDLARVLADHLNVPFVDLDERQPDLMVREVLNGEAVRRYRAVPVERWSDQLVVALVDPLDVFVLDDLRVLTGERILPTLADPGQIDRAIERLYHESGVESSLDDVSVVDDNDKIPDEIVDVTGGPIVRLASALLDQAVVDRASDLHIEPIDGAVRMRMRVDGMLHITSEAPLSVLRPLVSRLKVMGGLDIAQNRIPQDGRFSLTAQGRSVDVRIATVPTAYGEAVVMRMLDSARGLSDVASLDLSDDEKRRFLPLFQSSQGAVFITGPTGSGKSSTLYAMLSSINAPHTSIVSVEDPVEYRLSGVKQIQINTRAGMTFPSALRSILRADPDVILIGEVRDVETARIAADASITGHLVLSTLHATRAAAGPLRLIDMGVEPYLVSSAMTCVAAQRLYRRLCDACARDVTDPHLPSLRNFGATDAMLDAGMRVREAVGCPLCLNTGYRGRAAILEILPISESIGRLIVERATSAEVERVGVEEGMDTLRVAAMKRVLRGDMSIEEMIRVVG